jgi:hypothetical protein
MIVAGCVMVSLPHLFKVDESDEQRCGWQSQRESANGRYDTAFLPRQKWKIKRKYGVASKETDLLPLSWGVEVHRCDAEF